MNGLKTILAMIVAAYVVPKLASLGLSLTAEEQAQIVGLGVAVVGIAMRFASTGPALAGVREWAGKLGSSGLSKLTPDEVNQLTNLIIRELKDRQAASKAKETK